MKRRVFILAVFAVPLCRGSWNSLCEYDACDSSNSSIEHVHDELAALQVHVGSLQGSTSQDESQSASTSEPQFTIYHDQSNNLCGGAFLRKGPSAGQSACEKRCAADPSCKFFSFWWTGNLNWCKLSEACDNLEQQRHTITIYQRQEDQVLPEEDKKLPEEDHGKSDATESVSEKKKLLASNPIFQAQAKPHSEAAPKPKATPKAEAAPKPKATPKAESAPKTEASEDELGNDQDCVWIERMLKEEVTEFGDEATAKALKDKAAKTGQELTDAIENAEVAETKRAVYKSLSRLRKATIEEFDIIANNETKVIDVYNSERHYRSNLLEPTMVEVSRHKVPEFGDNATAKELHKKATKYDEALTRSLEKDEEAETKEAAYDALVTLHSAIIAEFDTIANNETEAIDAYNAAHHYQDYLKQYGLLEVVAFGNETTVKELQKNATETQAVLVRAVQKAEVAVIQEVVFEKLTKLRAATIKEYDTIAANETGVIAEYNTKHDFSDWLTSLLQSSRTEPVGSEDKLKRLQKNSSTTQAALVTAIADASVSAVKVEIWQDLKLLRTATITEYDTIAYNATKAVDAYNAASRYSTANPFGK